MQPVHYFKLTLQWRRRLFQLGFMLCLLMSPLGCSLKDNIQGSIGDSSTDATPTPTPPSTTSPLLAAFAGNLGGRGSLDGTLAVARFYAPRGLAMDSAGNTYVTEAGNCTIRKITPAGIVSTLAGTAEVCGSADGTGTAATFNYTEGIATDSAGNVYVADINNHTIRKITPAGVVTTFAGTAGVGGNSDGTGTAATFYYPYGIATDSADNIYVADSSNHTIRKITPAGVVTTFAGDINNNGSADGTGTAATFYYPDAIATDSADNVYVTDTGNHTIRKITPAGVVTTLAGTAGVSGNSDGTGTAATFNSPYGIATDSASNVYVADSSNHTIRKITPAGVVTTLAGTAGVSGNSNGTGTAATFNYPNSIATDSAGNIYVADMSNHTIRKITPAGVVSTFVGGGPTQGGFVAGALPGILFQPQYLTIRGASLYITLYNGVAVVQNLP